MQLNPDHQAATADLDDIGRGALVGKQLPGDQLTHGGGVVGELASSDGLHHGQAGSAGQRVAAKGGAVLAGAQHRCGRAPRKAGTYRYPVAQPLCRGDHVRHQAQTLAGEIVACAAVAGLHLVQHQQPFLLIADLAHRPQVLWAERVHAALALDRLQQYRHHPWIVGGNLAQGLYVIARGANEAGDQRFEAGLDLAVAGCTQGGQGAAVEGALEYHDGGLVDPALVAVKTGQFDGGLVGLGAGVAKKTVLHAGDRCQRLAQLLLGLDPVQVGGVHQFVCLLADGRGDRGVSVAQAIDRDAGYGVEVASAPGVIQVHSLAVTERHRQPGVSLHQRRHESRTPINAKRQRELPRKRQL